MASLRKLDHACRITGVFGKEHPRYFLIKSMERRNREDYGCILKKLLKSRSPHGYLISVAMRTAVASSRGGQI